jgi:hypothetical protein
MPDLKKDPSNKPPAATGRPRKKIDLDMVELYSRLFPSDEDMSVMLGCSRRTIARVKNRLRYIEAVRRGQVRTRMEIKKKQLEMAMDGDRTMIIYLGKVLCGQIEEGDKPRASELENKGEAPTRAPSLNDFYNTVKPIALEAPTGQTIDATAEPEQSAEGAPADAEHAAVS